MHPTAPLYSHDEQMVEYLCKISLHSESKNTLQFLSLYDFQSHHPLHLLLIQVYYILLIKLKRIETRTNTLQVRMYNDVNITLW